MFSFYLICSWKINSLLCWRRLAAPSFLSQPWHTDWNIMKEIPGRKPGFVKTYETNQISCCQLSQVAPALLITAEVRSTSAGEIEFVIKLKCKNVSQDSCLSQTEKPPASFFDLFLMWQPLMQHLCWLAIAILAVISCMSCSSPSAHLRAANNKILVIWSWCSCCGRFIQLIYFVKHWIQSQWIFRSVEWRGQYISSMIPSEFRSLRRGVRDFCVVFFCFFNLVVHRSGNNGSSKLSNFSS